MSTAGETTAPSTPAAELAPGAPRVTFFYDFSSPFSYLAATQLPAICKRTGARADYKPFLLGALFKLVGTTNVPLFEMSAAKRRHSQDDLFRWADHYGVPFRFASRFPMNTVLPLRVALAAGPDLVRLTDRIYAAAWVEDRDVSDAAVLTELLEGLGLDASELLQAAQTAPIKDELRANTDEAAAAGACGAPSFLVGHHLFWGQDRLHFVEKALTGWDPDRD